MTTIVEPTQPRKRKLPLPVVLIAVVLVSVGAFAIAKRARHPTATAASASSEPVPVAVETESVSEAEVPLTLRLPGTLRGNRETDLAANADGRLISTHVERGDTVKPGQVLAKVDVREAALSARQASAEAQSARVQEEQGKLECDRYETLFKKGAVSDQEYQQRITQCRTLPLSAAAAGARASLAAKNVGDGIIRAPFAGVVTERYVEVGQYVRQDSRVVTIVSLDQLRLEFSVPEADVSTVRAGMTVGFGVAAFPNRKFNAIVRYISGAINPKTRDLTVEALVENTSGELKSGMFADVDVLMGNRKLPVLRRSAIVEKDGQAHAFFDVNGRVEERVLALGNASGERVGVLKGARPGERVVVGDLAHITNGQRVVERGAR